jgi:hypothetical protein
MDIVSIFCTIDDFCELFEPHWQQHLLAAASKQRDRKPRLCLSEVLTIIVVFHLSGHRTFKGYYTQHVLPYQLHYFPKLVSIAARKRRALLLGIFDYRVELHKGTKTLRFPFKF